MGKVKEYQVETIVDALCANMRSDKEQLRDIAGIGLKTVLSELPPAAAGTRPPGRGTNVLCPSLWLGTLGNLTRGNLKKQEVSS